ncbi:MAG: response regulator transcription factor [Donghicola eburneus]|nr:response regulator transcription factor [Donghicola eburneus]MCI5038996.1 response regulator transcription factor [Donghicola eburneus]
MNILIVEDDPDLGELISDSLSRTGKQPVLVSDGEAGLTSASSGVYDAIVLDAMLPSYSGFEICQRLREGGITTPILFLTCRDSETDILRGLRLGADDYMTKPFSNEELSVRIDALIRRATGYSPQDHLTCGDLVLRTAQRQLFCGTVMIDLTGREYDLIRAIMSARGQALSRDALLERVWGDEENHTANVVDVYISYLRRKLKRASSTVQITTVRGFGFRLDAPEAD